MRNSRKTKVLRKIAYVIITALLIHNTCGCGSISDVIDAAEEASSDEKPGAIKVIDINGDIHETSVDVIDEAEAEDDETYALPASNLAMAAQSLSFSEDRNFAYSGLNESAQNSYREIYTILTEHLEKVELSSRDTDEVDLAFRAVMLDNPQIFYVKGYSIGKYMNGKILTKIVFSGTYTMSKDDADRKADKVDEYVRNVIDNAPVEGGDYDKIKYVYDYLIRNNEYDINSENNQNILSVVDNGRTVCQGYTKMMQLILSEMGIFCTLVNGTACGRNGVPDADDLKDAQSAEWGGHVWNIVKCDGMYYNVDVTWGDAAITLMNSDGTVTNDIDVNYEFFLVNDASLDDTHHPEPVVKMPKCFSMEDNYYNHEGVYFTRVDEKQLRRAFESALSSGESHVFIKAADDQVFEALEDHLFDGQMVFDYMGRSNVRYVEFPERDLIMISL